MSALLIWIASSWGAGAPGEFVELPVVEGKAQLPAGLRRLPVAIEGEKIVVDGRYEVKDGRVSIPLPIRSGGRTRLVSFELQVRDGKLLARHALERHGAVVLEGRLRAWALVDGNQDLRFQDARFDRVRFDVDGDGRAQGAHETFDLDEDFACGDGVYRFARGDATGRRVSFEPQSGQVARKERRGDPFPEVVQLGIRGDAAAVKELMARHQTEEGARMLRLLRRPDALQEMTRRLRSKDRDFLLPVLGAIPDGRVADALLRLRRRQRGTVARAAIDRALLGQTDEKVV
ncbi:MAG: hypothetical protein AAGD14_10410, partial [Planctomycetota bacterium]